MTATLQLKPNPAELLWGPSEEVADIQQAIRAGLPFAALASVASVLELSQREVTAVLGAAPRTLARRKRQRRLSPIESDRLYRLARIARIAAETLGSMNKARAWLGRPNRAFGGATPLGMLDTEIGARQVEDALIRINHGMYS